MNSLTTITRKPSRIALAAVLALGAPMAVALPEAPAFAQSSQQLDRAANALRSITTMRADFSQTDRNGATVNGKLTLKNPGKIRFEYAKGANMLVVSNGKSLYLVDYDVDQVERWPISKSPLGALLDPNRDVKQYGKVVQTSNPDVVSIEVRDKARPEFGVITLIFVKDAASPGGLKLTHWVALDAQNNRTTVRLRNHKYGTAVSDSAFTFNDPRRSSRRPG